MCISEVNEPGSLFCFCCFSKKGTTSNLTQRCKCYVHAKHIFIKKMTPNVVDQPRCVAFKHKESIPQISPNMLLSLMCIVLQTCGYDLGHSTYYKTTQSSGKED